MYEHYRKITRDVSTKTVYFDKKQIQTINESKMCMERMEIKLGWKEA